MGCKNAREFLAQKKIDAMQEQQMLMLSRLKQALAVDAPAGLLAELAGERVLQPLGAVRVAAGQAPRALGPEAVPEQQVVRQVVAIRIDAVPLLRLARRLTRRPVALGGEITVRPVALKVDPGHIDHR